MIPIIFVPIFLLAHFSFSTNVDVNVVNPHKISKLTGWNKIFEIHIADVAAFSHVSFYVMRMENKIADPSHEADCCEISPAEIMAHNYFAFRVCNPSPELKRQLKNSIEQFNHDYFVKQRAADNSPIVAILATDNIFEECSTNIATDISYKSSLSHLDNVDLFNEIKNIFGSDLSIHRILKKGLEIIYDQCHE